MNLMIHELVQSEHACFTNILKIKSLNRLSREYFSPVVLLKARIVVYKSKCSLNSCGMKLIKYI